LRRTIDNPISVLAEVGAMREIKLVATACLGGIALMFCYMFDFFPLIATVAFLGALGYIAFAPNYWKKQPPAVPWYMK
jgi:hypothetical protein